MYQTSRCVLTGLSSFAALLLGSSTALADVGVGDDAPMFKTINEDMEPLDMANFIEGKPLALCVGSAS